MAGTYSLGIARGKIEIDSSDFDKIQAGANKMGNVMLGAGAVVAAGFGYAIKSAADFQQQLDHFAAVTNTSGADMDIIRTKALQLGRDSAYGAGEVAKAFVELGKAGISAKEIAGGVGDAAVTLAAAADISVEKASENVVNIMRTFNKGAGDAVHIADILQGAANASTVEVDDLATSFKYAGSVAQATGVPMEDLAATFALLGNNGIRGSTAGTSMRMVMLSLAPTSKKAAEMMQELGLMTKEGGNQFFDASGKMKSMAEISQILHDTMGKLTPMQQEMAYKTIFGNRAMASAIILAKGGAGAFNEMKQEMGKTTAADVMAQRLDNLNGRIKIFKSSIQTAFIQAGTPMQESLKGMVEWLTKLVNAFAQLSPETQGNIIKIAGLAAAFLLAGGVIFKAVSTVMKVIKVYQEVKKAIEGITVVNKLMGASWLEAIWPIVAIIAVLAAVGFALYELYKHSETFRNFVDGMWQGIQKAWDIMLGTLQGALDWLRGNWFELLLVLLTGPLGIAIVVWRHFGDDILGFFTDLPGYLAYAVGYAIGFLVKSFFEAPDKMMDAVTTFGPKIWDFFWGLGEWVLPALGRGGETMVNFFIGLPGRLISAMIDFGPRIFKFLFDAMVNTHVAVWNGSLDMVNFFIKLPGRIMDAIKDLASDIWNAFTNIGHNMWEGFKKAAFGSPKTKVEYALLDMLDTTRFVAAAMKGELGDIGNGLNSIDGAKVTLTSGIGAGVASPAQLQAINASAAPTGFPAASGSDAPGGDTFIINRADEKSAREISQEIIADKRVRVG